MITKDKQVRGDIKTQIQMQEMLKSYIAQGYGEKFRPLFKQAIPLEDYFLLQDIIRREMSTEKVTR